MSGWCDAGARPGGAWQSRGCGPMGWRAFEIAAVIVGFMVWWPLGLAVIALKIAQRKGYVAPDWFETARQRVTEAARDFGQGPRKSWRPFETSGNAAFDEWRAAELERLEEERRKLEAAEREFAEHMDNLRKARDREEFERFMAARRGSNPSA